MKIEFKRLVEVNRRDIISLMNNNQVRRHMPLLTSEFSEGKCESFIKAKEEHWREFGFGLYAFEIGNRFVGWGGLQRENDDIDLALVLHPDHWGIGKILYKRFIQIAFVEMELMSITILLPKTRIRIQGLKRLGFEDDGEIELGQNKFMRFRLKKV